MTKQFISSRSITNIIYIWFEKWRGAPEDKNIKICDGLVFGLEIFVDYQETRTPRKLEHFGELFCKPGKLERSSFPGKDCIKMDYQMNALTL